MNITEFALNHFRSFGRNVTIEFIDGHFAIICGDIKYNGDLLSCEEALMSALIFFEAEILNEKREKK